MIHRLSLIRVSKKLAQAACPLRLRHGGTVLLRLVLVFAVGLLGCRPKPQAAGLHWLKSESERRGPMARVRVGSSLQEVRLGPVTTLMIQPTDTAKPSHRFAAPLSIHRVADGFTIHPRAGPSMKWQLSALRIVATDSPTIFVNGQPFPGQVCVHTVGDRQSDRFDVVNHVPIEEYLPGVLDRELPQTWQSATYRAQAIAARSYAIKHIAEHTDRHFDLESTIASQVYGGSTRNDRALSATRATCGSVLTHDGHILPAYYSSCCGGTGQDASVAFPGAEDATPLRGRFRGNWCANSRFYRWGPIIRPAHTLAKRLAAWGVSHGHAIASIRGLQRITIRRRNNAGRPAQVSIQDREGRTFSVPAEAFRFACNYRTATLPPLSSDQQLRSAHVRVAVSPPFVHFTEGRGYGHGVGLCQHGSEALARFGYSAFSILNFYYPGAAVQRIY